MCRLDWRIYGICYSVNHTRFPKEDHLPDRARRDNKDTKGDRVDNFVFLAPFLLHGLRLCLFAFSSFGTNFPSCRDVHRFTVTVADFMRYANARQRVIVSLCFVHNPQGDRTEQCATGHYHVHSSRFLVTGQARSCKEGACI